MNSLRRICSVFAMVCLLSMPVVAGELGTPGRTDPGEVDGPGRTANSTEPGEQETPGKSDPGDQNTPPAKTWERNSKQNSYSGYWALAG